MPLACFMKTILRILSRFVYDSRDIQSTFSFLVVKNLFHKRLKCMCDLLGTVFLVQKSTLSVRVRSFSHFFQTEFGWRQSEEDANR